MKNEKKILCVSCLFVFTFYCFAEGYAWMREDFDTHMHQLGCSTHAAAITTNGLLHVKDTGVQQGELVVLNHLWGVIPERGGVFEARVKVVSCSGEAGVVICCADGVHEDILTLYTDKIELSYADKSYAMDTTETYHVYRVEIKDLDIKVWVDGVLAIDAPGLFTHPAHKSRNYVSYGAGSSPGTGEAYWDWVRWIQTPVKPGRNEFKATNAVHSVVYKELGKYACFPSLRLDKNSNTFFTSFAVKGVASHFETADTERFLMATNDSGDTWYKTNGIPSEAIYDFPKEYAVGDNSETLVRICSFWWHWYPMERLSEFKDKYYIRHSTSAIGKESNTFATCSGGYIERSEDGGKRWSRTVITELDTYMSGTTGWSSAQLSDGTVVQAFKVAESATDKAGIKVVRTSDGISYKVVDVTGSMAQKVAFTEETLLYATSDDTLWMLTRAQEGGEPFWQSVSYDGGFTWETRVTDIKISNSPASGLVKLDDGRLVLICGHRDVPYGIRAFISEDEGLSWRTDHVLVLRDDGGGLDLGYPRAFKVSDNQILAIYYYATYDKVRHIACTRFKVPDLPPRKQVQEGL